MGNNKLKKRRYKIYPIFTYIGFIISYHVHDFNVSKFLIEELKQVMPDVVSQPSINESITPRVYNGF